MDDRNQSRSPYGENVHGNDTDNRGEAGPDGSRRHVYTLEIELEDGPITKEQAGTRIARTIQVRGNQTLHAFHSAIFTAFERSEERLYEFNMGKKSFDSSGTRYTPHAYYADSAREEIDAHDAALTPVDSLGLAEGQIFYYLFDFGDCWMHKITVRAVGEADAGGEFPKIIEKTGESPQQFAYLEKASQTGHPPLEGPEMLTAMMQYLQSEWRRETEQQPIRLKTNLKTALKKLPLQWVKAMCAEAGLPVFPRASERVQALAEHLSDEKTLKAVWAKLPEASRRMAAWLVLDKQGGAAISALTEKFGPDADRSWYWDEGELPATPLGLLRLHGLVFVGATRIGQTREKVAVVPVELRPELRKCAAASDAFSDAPPLPPQPEQVSSSVEDSEIKEYLQQVLLNGPDASLTEMTELEHFLERYPLTKATEWLYSMVIENVISRPREFHPDAIRALVERMIEAGGTESRLLAYQLGADVFGPAFAEPATDEKSAKIRKWAQKRLGRSDDKTPR